MASGDLAESSGGGGVAAAATATATDGAQTWGPYEDGPISIESRFSCQGRERQDLVWKIYVVRDNVSSPLFNVAGRAGPFRCRSVCLFVSLSVNLMMDGPNGWTEWNGF